MVKHIVMWSLKDEALGKCKKENMERMKSELEALNGHVPGLLSLEVGFDFSQGEYDLALVSVHESRDALCVYATHPDHVLVKNFVAQVVTKRTSVDFDMK